MMISTVTGSFEKFDSNLNRKDFGLTWSAVTEAGNVVVSDKVKFSASLQFTKQ